MEIGVSDLRSSLRIQHKARSNTASTATSRHGAQQRGKSLKPSVSRRQPKVSREPTRWQQYLSDSNERYFPYKNGTQETAIFNTMFQKENQPIDDFIAEFQHQAVKCGDFGGKHDHLQGDRIIVGIRDAALRERLFREKDLTLEKIIATCRSAEITKQHVTSPARTSHEQEATVARLSKKGQLKLDLPTVTYPGHQLTQQGVTSGPRKVKAINAIPAPTCEAELLRFLGMATYLMKFVPNFSAKTQPFRELLKSGVAWHWTQKMTDAFNDIKRKLTTAPSLALL
ncbi:hypothetical protein MRX96_021534 [Rhipicephalus microplus]